MRGVPKIISDYLDDEEKEQVKEFMEKFRDEIGNLEIEETSVVTSAFTFQIYETGLGPEISIHYKEHSRPIISEERIANL